MANEFEVDVLYEKCRVLISVLGNEGVSEFDKGTFVFMLEEYFVRLGDAIEKLQTK